MLVERRHAHVCQVGQVVDRDRLSEVLAHPRDRLGDALDARLLLTHQRDTGADRTPQEANQDLVDHQRRQQFRVRGLRHQFDEPRRRVDDGCRRLAHAHAPGVARARHTVRVNLERQFGDLYA